MQMYNSANRAAWKPQGSQREREECLPPLLPLLASSVLVAKRQDWDGKAVVMQEFWAFSI